VFSVPPAESLSTTEVGTIIAQAAAEARARNAAATIAVTDRVGNVLAVFAMPDAGATATISAAPNGQNIDVQGLVIPSAGAAIAKAITGAYLSSGGNAFSSRTASFIVQEHFPPAPTTAGLESGPLAARPCGGSGRLSALPERRGRRRHRRDRRRSLRL
jgi:Ca2+-binding RTX toxin-like protein